jgi:hypothetical protein
MRIQRSTLFGLLALLTLAAPAVAALIVPSSSLSLQLAPQRTSVGHAVGAIVVASFAAPVELDVFVRSGSGGCAATSSGEKRRIDAHRDGYDEMPISMLLDRPLPGTSRQRLYVLPPVPGSYRLCGYLVGVNGNPASLPVATATAAFAVTDQQSASGGRSKGGQQSGGSAAIRAVSSREWVVFDGTDVACLGIDAAGQIPGVNGIACFVQHQKRLSLSSIAAELYAWRSGEASRVDIGSLSAFLNVSTFAHVTTGDVYVPLKGAIRMPGTAIICQSTAGNFLDPGHPSVWCFITSADAQLTRGALSGVVYSASQTSVGFEKHPDAVRVDGSSGFLVDTHLVGAIRVPHKGKATLLTTQAQQR